MKRDGGRRNVGEGETGPKKAEQRRKRRKNKGKKREKRKKSTKDGKKKTSSIYKAEL